MSEFKKFYRTEGVLVLTRELGHILALVRQCASLFVELHTIRHEPFEFAVRDEEFPVLCNATDYFFGMLTMYSDMPCLYGQLLGHAEHDLEDARVWRAVAFHRVDVPVRCKLRGTGDNVARDVLVRDAIHHCVLRECFVFEKVLESCEL